MANEHAIRRYRSWYAKLLHLYPKPYHRRFGEGMEQTFGDLLRERAAEEKRLLDYAVWMSVETSIGIIKENLTFTSMRNKRLIGIVLAATCVLLVPLVAMQFTSEVNWTGSDFVFAGVLLYGTGLLFELAMRKANNTAYRAGIFFALAAMFLLTWVNAAVGIIGEDNPANTLYLGVPLIGIFGAMIAGFKAQGMSRALFVTAVAQMLVPVIAVSVWNYDFSPGVVRVFILNAFFTALWIASALMFRLAGGINSGKVAA